MNNETWHLSASYGHWSPYCQKTHVRHVDFQTFRTDDVTCIECKSVAEGAWGPAYFSKQVWGV